MIVVDASVLAPALVDDFASGDIARRRLRGQVPTAPEIIDLEVTSVLRGLAARNVVPARRAALAMRDLAELPLRRARHLPLLRRCWELRHGVTSYDAAYVALAELLDLVLVTADAHLSRTPNLRCSVEVLT